MERASAQPQGKLSFFPSISLKNEPLERLDPKPLIQYDGIEPSGVHQNKMKARNSACSHSKFCQHFHQQAPKSNHLPKCDLFRKYDSHAAFLSLLLA